MLDDPAATGNGAGADAQLARAMQGAAIPITETTPERTWIWAHLHLADRSILLVSVPRPCRLHRADDPGQPVVCDPVETETAHGTLHDVASPMPALREQELPREPGGLRDGIHPGAARGGVRTGQTYHSHGRRAALSPSPPSACVGSSANRASTNPARSPERSTTQPAHRSQQPNDKAVAARPDQAGSFPYSRAKLDPHRTIINRVIGCLTAYR